MARKVTSLPGISSCEGEDDMEVAIHSCPKSLLSDVQAVFHVPQQAVTSLHIVLTLQRARVSLAGQGADIEAEKDRLLHRFNAAVAVWRPQLESLGYWVDYVDPCSGLAMCDRSSTRSYNEVEAAELLMKYHVQNLGCCKILLHPNWGSAVYPATVVTNAPLRALDSVIHGTAFPHTEELIGGVISHDKLARLQAREEALFIQLHPRSKANSGSLLGGVPMPWMKRLPGSFPLTVDNANGAHFVDADGIDYTDLCLGDTGAMTGHAVPQVAEAIYHRAKQGITTMMPSSDAGWVADELKRRFGLPLWQVAMSATDANRFVLRIARHVMKKPKIAVMDWCYHGTVDETLAVLDPVTGEVVPRPGAIGPQCPVNLTTRIARFNDIASLEACLAHGDVACLLMEPALTNIGIVLPKEGYLQQVREVTRRHGVLLVVDETHTICAGPGGAARAWGLEADMLVIGKPIGGGMPVAAYGMTKEVGDLISAQLAGSDIDVSGIGGTLTGNSMALAAVRAALSSSLRDEDYAITIPLATEWVNGVREVINEFSLPWSAQQLGCRAEYWFCDPAPCQGSEAAATNFHELESYMHIHALNRGLLLTPFHNMALFSPRHASEDVRVHTRFFREAVLSLIED